MSNRNTKYPSVLLLTLLAGAPVLTLASETSSMGRLSPRIELQTSDQIGGISATKGSSGHGKSAAEPAPMLEVSGALGGTIPAPAETTVEPVTQKEEVVPTVAPVEEGMSAKARDKAEAKAAREARKQADAQARESARVARENQRQEEAQAKEMAKAAAAERESAKSQEAKPAVAESRQEEAPTQEKIEFEAKKARGSANFKAKAAAELQSIADEKAGSAHRAQARAEDQADVAAKARAEAKSAARDAAEAKVKSADAAKALADLEAKAAAEALDNVGSGSGVSASTEAAIVAAREEARQADAAAKSKSATASRAKAEADMQADAAELARSKAESQARTAHKAAEEAQLAAHDAAVAKAKAAAAAQAVADFEAKSAADAIARAQARAQAAADAKARADADVIAARSGAKPQVDPGIAVKSAVAARLALPVITEPYTALKLKDAIRVPGWDISIIGVSRPGSVLASRGAADQTASVGEWVVVFLELRNTSNAPQSVLDYNFQIVSSGAAAGCQNPEAGGCRYFISGLSEARGLYQQTRGLTVLHSNYDKREFAPGAMARTAVVFDLPVSGFTQKFGIGDSYVDLGTLKNVPVTPSAAK
jgi:hypothetical protein